MIIITTYIMLIFRLYRATPYSQTFEPWRKKFSKEKKKKKKSSEIHLLISLKSRANYQHLCDKNLLNSCCTRAAIKEDLQSCSSLIVILRVSWGEKFTQTKQILEYLEQTFYFKTNYLNALNFINFHRHTFMLLFLLNKIIIFDSILLNSSNKYSRHPPLSFYDFLNHFLQLIDAISTSTWSTRSFFSRIGRKKSK